MSANQQDHSIPSDRTDSQRDRPASQANRPSEVAGGPALQGEGDYTAARRHREAAERFVESGAVDAAAREAQPRDADEARAMAEAEKAGRAHARR